MSSNHNFSQDSFIESYNDLQASLPDTDPKRVLASIDKNLAGVVDKKIQETKKTVKMIQSLDRGRSTHNRSNSLNLKQHPSQQVIPGFEILRSDGQPACW